MQEPCAVAKFRTIDSLCREKNFAVELEMYVEEKQVQI